jgi:hypothetical protein
LFFLSYFVNGQICNATPNKYHSSTSVALAKINFIFGNAEIFRNYFFSKEKKNCEGKWGHLLQYFDLFYFQNGIFKIN